MLLGIITGLVGIITIILIWSFVSVNGISSGIIGIIGVVAGAITAHFLNIHSEYEKEKQELKVLKRRIHYEINSLSVELGTLYESIDNSGKISEVLNISLEEPAKSQDLFEKAESFKKLSYRIIDFIEDPRSFLPAVESLCIQIDNLRLYLT
jgi:hypothetical protein